MDEHQFAQQLLPMKQKIFRFALSITGQRDEAEDVMQDIYERMWLRRASLDNCTNIESFVMSSVRNLSLDRVRSRKLHGQKMSVVKADLSSASNRQTDTFDMREIVEKVIASLPQNQQSVIHLRDVEGYEIDDIAQIMDLESTNVRVILSRARKTVKEKIIEITSYGIRK